MFWNKEKQKESKIYNKILELISVMQIQMKSMEAEIEFLNAKFKKKVYDQLPEPELEQMALADHPSQKFNDGFDHIRKLRKEDPNAFD